MRERSWNCTWTLQYLVNRERPQGIHPWRRPKAHKRKLEMREQWQGEIFSNHRRKKGKTVFACMCEAFESTRKRIPETQNKDHEDHIAEKGFNSVSHYDLVMPQAMKTPDAKATVDKELDKLTNLQTWQESNVKGK